MLEGDPNKLLKLTFSTELSGIFLKKVVSATKEIPVIFNTFFINIGNPLNIDKSKYFLIVSLERRLGSRAVTNRTRSLPDKDDQPPGTFSNYYLGMLKSILCGSAGNSVWIVNILNLE